MNHTPAFSKAFNDPVHDAQATFRAMLAAMARPGTIAEISAAPIREVELSTAAAACCLTLLDSETALWLGPSVRASQVSGWLRFHTGTGLVPKPDRCGFALVTDPTVMPDLESFDWGNDEWPERSTLAIVEASGLDNKDGWALRGPGIDGQARLRVDGIAETFAAQHRAMRPAAPRGMDFIFTCGNRLAALPRTSQIGN